MDESFRTQELIDIDKAVENFSVKMIYRMRTKMLEGFTGWATEGDVSSVSILSRMLSKALLLNPSDKDLIDIANFAMMLYHRRRQEVDCV